MSNSDGHGRVQGHDEDPPAGWPKPRKSFGRVGSIILFALFTSLLIFLTVDEVLHGSAWQALLWAGAALLFGHSIGMLVNLMHRLPQATGEPARGANDQGEPGLAFEYWRWPYYWLSVVMVISAAALVGYAVTSASTGSVAGIVTGLLLAGAAIYSVGYTTIMLRTAPGVVVISASGIYHRSLVFEHFVPWENVVQVEASAHDTPWITVKVIPLPGIRTKNHTGRFSKGAELLPFMIIRAHWLGRNAVPAYLAICRYFYHPELRAELPRA